MEMKELTLEKFEEASEIVEKVTQETKMCIRDSKYRPRSYCTKKPIDFIQAI